MEKNNLSEKCSSMKSGGQNETFMYHYNFFDGDDVAFKSSVSLVKSFHKYETNWSKNLPESPAAGDHSNTSV